MKLGLALPIAAAWLFMSDNTDYRTIPQQWSAINFNTVDALFVGPAGIQANGMFGLYHSNTTGDLSNRFKWVIKTARSQNPNIKIIASQWYSSTPTVWGYDLSSLNTTQAINKYSDSVQTFMKTWLPVSGGIDGYDIDYEGSNIVENIGDIVSSVRSKLNTLTKSSGRPFYMTVSPSVVLHLYETVPYIDLVNMQNYGGSYNLDPNLFLNVGFKSRQLMYGICPETDCESRNVTEVEAAYNKYNVSGVHLWRLNSDDYKAELAAQKKVYNFLHPNRN